MTDFSPICVQSKQEPYSYLKLALFAVFVLCVIGRIWKISWNDRNDQTGSRR